jgi:hypothetical protein
VDVLLIKSHTQAGSPAIFQKREQIDLQRALGIVYSGCGGGITNHQLSSFREKLCCSFRESKPAFSSLFGMY